MFYISSTKKSLFCFWAVITISIILSSCSQSQDKPIVDDITLDLNASQSEKNLDKEETLAIYIGDMFTNGKLLKSTLTLIDPNEYTLEQVEVKESDTLNLYASTGTYEIKEKNPLNGISQDVITLKPDDSEYPDISLTFLEDDSLALLDENSVVTPYVLQKQRSQLDSSY